MHGFTGRGRTVKPLFAALTAVSDMNYIRSMPRNSRRCRSHAIGLGQMNLHGYLAREGVPTRFAEALDFTNFYFYTITVPCILQCGWPANTGKTFRICAVALCQRHFYAVFTGRRQPKTRRESQDMALRSGGTLPTRNIG